MSQLTLFKDKPLQPDFTLGEPIVWVQRIVLLESLEVKEPIRDITFRRGLNIIATAEASPEDDKPVGHDVGKTMLIRIIRYCLGEDHYCDEQTRRSVAHQYSAGYVMGKFRVAGQTWCVARPLGLESGAASSWCRRCDDLELVRVRDDAERFSVFVKALNEATRDCYQEVGLPHADNRYARWQDLLGWISRDQDCLFTDHATWRTSDSYAGPRVLLKEDAYLVMRMALGLLNDDEVGESRKHEQLKALFAEKQIRYDKLKAYLEEAEVELRKILKERKCDLDESPGGGFFGATVKDKADQNIASLTRLQQEQAVPIDQSELTRTLKRQGVLEYEADALVAQKNALKKLIDELNQQDEETFLAKLGDSGFKCEFWKTEEEAKVAGCPGEPPRSDMDPVEFRKQLRIQEEERNIEEVDRQLIEARRQLNSVSQDVGKLTTAYKSAVKNQQDQVNGIVEIIGRWRELKAMAENYRLVWDEFNVLDQSLETKDRQLRIARDKVAVKRKEIQLEIGKLSSCYNAIVKEILASDAEGAVVVDGNGINPQISNVSSSGTTLKICSKVLGFDLGCLLASICGTGHLPRLWMHDSPRAADTEDVMYYKLMHIVSSLEEMFKGTEPTFQHIWTTTSCPPSDLDKKPFVRERLHARSDEGKLLKRSLK